MTVRLIAALIAPLLVTQATFEGKLRMRTIELQLEEAGLKESWLELAPAALAAREGAEVEEATLQIRNNVMRMENKDGGQGFGLLDFGRKVMTVIDGESRSYLEFPLPAADGMPAAGAARPALPTVKPLGQTRTMNGVKVTGYEIRSRDQIIRAWMTQDFPGLTWTFRSAAAQGEGSDDPEAAGIAQLGRYGFPVLLITLTDRSVQYEETVSIERSALNADLFKVPAGFTKRSIPGGP